MADEQVTGQQGTGTPEGVATPPAQGAEGVPTPPAAGWTQWSTELPESIRKFKNPDDLAKSYIHLEKGLGNRVPVPGENATPEQIAEFHEKLGVPKDPTGYGEYAVPEGLAWDKGAEKDFYGAAHKAGLTPKQTKAMIDYHVQAVTKMGQAGAGESKAAEEKAWGELRTMWGANTDRNVALAQQTVQTLGDKEFVGYLNETGLGNHPAMLKFLAKVGEGLMEDGILKPELVGKSPASAKEEIATLMSHKSWADRDDPDHKRTIDKIRELTQIAYVGV